MSEPNREFHNRVALVTGGSRSIGRAISIALAAAGAHVVVNYRRDATAGDETVAEISNAGGSALAIQADISNPDDALRLVDAARATFGPVTCLVNNAAILRRTPLLELDPAEWNETLATNLTGTFLVSQAVARGLVDAGTKGSIVTVSSINERYARPGLTHYSASKAGVSMLTRQLALELAPYGIRANNVALGLFETDMNRERLNDQATRTRYLDQIPLRQFGEPRDAVGPVLFLLSDAARLVTGTTLTVDAGRSLS